MASATLRKRSTLERFGLVKVGDAIMTKAEASARGEPAELTNRSPVSISKSAVPAPQSAQSAASARAAERKRWEMVMLSECVKGRQRVAAAMLASGDERAETILAKLANTKTDAERQRAQVIERNAKASAVWDRAIAAVCGEERPR